MGGEKLQFLSTLSNYYKDLEVSIIAQALLTFTISSSKTDDYSMALRLLITFPKLTL